MHHIKKRVWLLLVITVFLLVPATKIHAQTTNSQTIQAIPKPTWIYNAGMSKGKYHDRQDLGFILPTNQELKVRQTNPNFTGKLTLRLLGNDSKLEKSVDVDSNWVTISADSPLVPFIDTPYGNTSATVEYQLTNSSKEKKLPIYEYHGNEHTFFQTWDQEDSDFALIKGKDFQLLIPKCDKELARNLKDFNNLDELLEHYNDLFSFYNKMAGFDNSSEVNQNGQNRYFLRADAHGAGGAYYSNNWASNSAKTTDMWLNKDEWADLHEIAHGYQAGFDDVGMYTGEVSNNLFGVQYQYAKYGKKADKTGWLFDYGKKETVENNLYQDLVTKHGTYDSLDLRGKLILLSLLKQKAGDESFTKMYQYYRKIANQPGFKKQDYPLPDLMNKIYSENSKQDFTPVLQRWGLDIDDTQASKNRTAQYPAVASLADVVPQDHLKQAHDLLDNNILINSNFEMVQNKDLSPLNLHGNLTLKLNSNDPKTLTGVSVTLQDGKKVVAQQTIKKDENTLSFKNLPNGIYTASFNGPQMDNCVPDNNYVYVKDTDNNATINLNKINYSSLTNQKIDFLGLGDDQFASLQTNLDKHQATFNVTQPDPHAYYKGEVYAQVVVRDSNNNVKFETTLLGTDNPTGAYNIDLNIGDTIEVYHAETQTRLRCDTDIIDQNNKNNSWLVTKWGLKNKSLQNDPQQDLIKQIQTQGTKLQQTSASAVAKKNLHVAIESLDEPYRTKYLSEYSDLANQRIDFLGLGDDQFASLQTNLDKHQATFNVTQPDPHAYYKGEVYAQVVVRDSNNNVKFETTLLGTDNPTGIYNIELNIGDTLEIYHAETQTRLRCDADIIDKTSQNNSWLVTKSGLKNEKLPSATQQDLVPKISSKRLLK